MQSNAGVLRILTEDDCLALLMMAPVGRVVVSIDAMPAAFPVNYVLIGRQIYFRTSAGSKLTAAVDGTVVAFQIDEINAVVGSGWSVLVVGAARLVTDPTERTMLDRAGIRSWATPADARYVAIGISRVTGRVLRSAPDDDGPGRGRFCDYIRGFAVNNGP